MARACTVCVHPQRPAIDQALVAGHDNLEALGARYGVTDSALFRHRTNHVPATLTQAKDAEAVALADDLLAQLRGLRSKAVALLLKAEQAGDIKTALMGIREARACVEVLLEVEQRIDRRPQINVLITPQWIEVREAIIVALAAYPDARHAVASALADLEAAS